MKALALRNGRFATMAAAGSAYGMVERGALVAEDGVISWIGAEADLPGDYAGLDFEDLGGRLVTPALIDCHTHLVHGGDRAREFELRLEGASYEDIARAGGGIRATVAATRAATEEALVEAALPRLDRLIAEGVGTVEIKSGYGLSLEAERRMLRAARTLGRRRAVRVVTTFLGLHAVPPEFEGDADGYVAEVAERMLPALAAEGLVDAVDGFCENIAFSPRQVERVFAVARRLGLPVKLHAEQLSDMGGAALAAAHWALSADHLEYLDDTGIAAMAESGTVAVLLPGAFYFLRESRVPPVAALRASGVGIALATDCNPGSSPLTSLLLAMNMGCVLFRLTPEEALAGVTREAARALGLTGEVGTLEAGKCAELAVWNVANPAELAYRMGCNPLWRRMGVGDVD